jgi:hypothetical protein
LHEMSTRNRNPIWSLCQNFDIISEIIRRKTQLQNSASGKSSRQNIGVKIG